MFGLIKTPIFESDARKRITSLKHRFLGTAGRVDPGLPWVNHGAELLKRVKTDIKNERFSGELSSFEKFLDLSEYFIKMNYFYAQLSFLSFENEKVKEMFDSKGKILLHLLERCNIGYNLNISVNDSGRGDVKLDDLYTLMVQPTGYFDNILGSERDKKRAISEMPVEEIAEILIGDNALETKVVDIVEILKVIFIIQNTKNIANSARLELKTEI